MDKTSSPASPETVRKRVHAGIVARIIVCVLILGAGVLIARIAISAKQDPPKAEQKEEVLQVETRILALTNIVTRLRGNAIAQPVRQIHLAPQVGGRVTEMPTELRQGLTVTNGQVLFRIDSRDYEIAVASAKAQVAQRNATATRLQEQLRVDQERSVLTVRNAELAMAEMHRTKNLFETENIGTKAGVELAEQNANQAANQALILEQSLALLPAQLEEVAAQRDAAMQALQQAELNLARCTVRAPFTARIASIGLEAGELVHPNQVVMTLADDSVLELQVPLESRDLRKWLRTKPGGEPKTGWLPEAEAVEARIRWIEGEEDLLWTGQVHRVVALDPTTRTGTLAVRVHAQTAGDASFPLVDGMFCEVTIPGKTLSDVFVLPRSAVTYDGDIYLSVSNRLQTTRVNVLHAQDEWVMVRDGLDAGAELVTTRLVAPLEGVKLSTGN